MTANGKVDRRFAEMEERLQRMALEMETLQKENEVLKQREVESEGGDDRG